MKVLIVLLALVAATYGKVSLEAVFKAQFNTFKATHGKVYSAAEEPQRLQNFMTNAHAIALHNGRFANGEVSFELGHNEFSDMDHEEFKQTMLGFRAPEGLQASNDNATVFKAQPGMPTAARIDWTAYTRSVRNQGQCGSCYSFSALGALEGALARKRGGSFDLSEQNIVDCSGSYGNYGCNGGFMTAVFKYIQANGGVNYEGDYPYETRQSTCRYNRGRASERIVRYVEVERSETALEQALNAAGPVAVALDANPRSFMLYKKGIYDEPTCGTRVSHAVLAVGYGKDDGKDYWIVKNSWGNGWGENGFFRIAKGVNRCGINSMSSYPVV